MSILFTSSLCLHSISLCRQTISCLGCLDGPSDYILADGPVGLSYAFIDFNTSNIHGSQYPVNAFAFDFVTLLGQNYVRCQRRQRLTNLAH